MYLLWPCSIMCEMKRVAGNNKSLFGPVVPLCAPGTHHDVLAVPFVRNPALTI